MPSLVSCKPRSPDPACPAVESPPRKKFKLSLKLKSKSKKDELKDDNNEENNFENSEDNGEFGVKVQEETMESSTENISTTVDKSDSAVQDPPLPYAGLANLGNTCYLNAVLQVLRYCPEFIESLANLNELCTMNKTENTEESTGDEETGKNAETIEKQTVPNIIHSIHKLACEMVNAEENYNVKGMEAEHVQNLVGCTTFAVHPRNFVTEFSGLRPMFGKYQQHDAQEFLRSFLSLIEDDCTGLTKGNNDEKPNVKEITVNQNESKVRGGCKYPNGVYTQSVAESTGMTLTAEDTRTQGACIKGVRKSFCVSDNVMSKPNQKSCPDCSAKKNLNIVQRLFEGTLQLQTRCLTCEVVRKRFENFQDISVPVQTSQTRQSQTDEVVALSDSENETEEDLNLMLAISKFASIERLQGDNKYFCENCGTLMEAEISTYFEKLPQVLTVHLKRFQTSCGKSLYTSNLVTKVTKSLHTPQQLSLEKWCSKTCSQKMATYQLFGVVMHSGMSSCSGHYLSYVNTDVMNSQHTQLNVCDCGKDEVLPVCSCPEKKEKMEVECLKETEDNQQEELVEKSPLIRGIAKYFKPITKRKNSAEIQNSSKAFCETPCTEVDNILCPVHINKSSDDCDKTENLMDENCQLSKCNWVKFDDAEVHKISDKEMDEILSPSTSCYSTPYLLFYFRV